MADLNVAVILRAVDKMSAPARRIAHATTDITAAASKLKQKYSAVDNKTQSVTDALNREAPALRQASESMNKASAAAGKLAAAQKTVGKRTTAATQAIKDQQSRLRRSVQDQLRANKDLRSNLRGQMLDAAALGVAFAAPVKAAITFESTMADVRKVVDFDTPQQFKKMGQDILDMSTRIPMTASGLGDIVAAAGQAGIARKELLRFAEDAAKMGVAFDMSGAQAGAAMTGLRSIFSLNRDQAVSLADSYNHLSNTMDARASDLLNIASRAGSSAKLFGLSGQQLGALGATFKALKTPTQVAGTSINAMLLKLSTAGQQPKQFQQALAELGWSAQQMKKAIGTDAQGALVKFLTSVKNSDDVMSILSRLFGAEYSDDVAKLIGGLDIYKEALGRVSSANKYQGSMLKEYEQRSKTTANSLQLLGNRITRLGVNLGSVLLPGVNKIVKALGHFTDKVADLANRFPHATKAIIAATTALVFGKIAALGFRYAWTFVRGGLLAGANSFLITTTALGRLNSALRRVIRKAGVGFVNAFGKAGTAALTFAANPVTSLVAGFKKITSALIGLGKGAVRTLLMGFRLLTIEMATNPIGLLIIAIGVAAVLVYKYWDRIKAFFGGVVEGFKAAIEPIKEAFEPLKPLFDAVGDAIGWVIDQVSSLFSPVKSSTAQLDKAASAGRKFGEWLAEGVKLAITPIEWLIDAVKWLKDSLAGKAISKAVSSAWKWAFGSDEEGKEEHKAAPTLPRAAVTKIPATDTLSRPVAKIPTALPRSAATKIPATDTLVRPLKQAAAITPIAAAPLAADTPRKQQPLLKHAHTSVTNNHITVVQRPGENGQHLARRIVREEIDANERRAGARRRGSLFDYAGATAQ